MKRLLIHVEGETEESFINEILEPHLFKHGYTRVSARLVGNSRQRHQRGGIRSWSAVRSDIIKHLKEDRACLATSMIDYYGLPQTGAKAWPGRKKANRLAYPQKANTVENALLTDVSRELGSNYNPNRFLPFVMMHEFEGLLFSDCLIFSHGIGRPDLAPRLQAIRSEFETPEEINDSSETAPSKRIIKLFPGYEKPLLGTLAVLEIGLDAIRAECPHFHSWLSRLEQW